MTVTEVARGNKQTFFSLRHLPQVIEMYAGLKGDNSPAYYAGHLDYWLRQCGIPGKPLSCYPDGALLAREDANIIKLSVRNIFGNFAFLYPKVSKKKAKKVAKALTRASKIFWGEMKNRKSHIMQVVEDSKNHRSLHLSLLALLNSSRFDNRQEDEIERIAEYFVLFCQEDKKILKKLAMKYYSSDKKRDEYMAYLPSAD